MLDDLAINRTDLSKKLNVGRTTITLWYRQYVFPIDRLIRIEKAIGYDLSSYFPKLETFDEREKMLNKAIRHKNGDDQVSISKDEYREYQNLKQKFVFMEESIKQKDELITTLRENIELLKSKQVAR